MRSGYDQMAILQLAAQRGTPAFAASPFAPPNVGAHVGQLESPEMALLRQRYPWLFEDPATWQAYLAAYYGYDPYVLTPAPAWYLPYPYPYWGWGGGFGGGFRGGHRGGFHGGGGHGGHGGHH